MAITVYPVRYHDADSAYTAYFETPGGATEFAAHAPGERLPTKTIDIVSEEVGQS